MYKKRQEHPEGFVLIELLVALFIAGIIIVGIGAVVADSHRGWNAMYNRTYSDIASDGHVARRMFDSVVRRATQTRFLLGDDGTWVEVYYCEDPNSTILDRYARFFATGGQLNIEYGGMNPRETLSVHTVCGNVQECEFKASGRSVQMILVLNDGSRSLTVVSSAVMHNQ